MAKKVKVYYDREMDTLDMWFDEPPKEGYSREIEDGLIIKYDSEARVVGNLHQQLFFRKVLRT